jgi:diacylglycerol kinase (ATP)
VSDALPPKKSAGGRLAFSFVWAFRGLGALLHTQANARIHLAATALVVVAGLACGITRGEWCAVVVVIGLVWTAEGLNTAIETVVDLVSPEHHLLAGRAKDVAAGAVLCAALTAAVIGLLVFVPRLSVLVGFDAF